MRDTILDAALDCFISIGFANTTTARIAEKASVSRGAMLHHFPSKTELMQAAVEYLHEKLLTLYSTSIEKVSLDLPVDERNRKGLEGYWNYLSSNLYVAYHELCVAGRTDPELKVVLENSQQLFGRHVHDTNVKLFEEWNDKGDRFLLAMDVTKFMMEGMAAGQLMADKEERVDRLLNYLADRLEEIFKQGENTAIGRHSTQK